MMQDLLAESVSALFADHATSSAARRAETDGVDRVLWRRICESGFDQALVGEERGGSGLGLKDAHSIFEACGRYPAAVPLSETVLARGIADYCGVILPAGMLSAAPAYEVDGIICAKSTPWGATCDWVLAIPPGQVAYLFPVTASLPPETIGFGATNGSDLSWPRNSTHLHFKLPNDFEWIVAGAAMRCAQIAGALNAVLDLSLQFVSQRHQFGRALAGFQAIQQQMAVLAEDCISARMAGALACHSEGVVPITRQVAVAKVVASEAASRGASISHAVHGAMGVTEEYDLQLYTRRLLAWRFQYGSEAFWAKRVGADLLASKANAWDHVRAAGSQHNAVVRA